MTDMHIMDKPDLFFERAEVATAVGSALQRRVGRGTEWSVAALAFRIGYSPSSVKSWMSATEPPSLPAFLSLARVMDDEFLTEVLQLIDMAALPLTGNACPLVVHAAAANYSLVVADALADNGRIDHNEKPGIIRAARRNLVATGGLLRAANAA